MILQLLLAFLALLGNCGWIIDGRRHREQVRSLQADTRAKDYDLAKRYVDDYHQRIVAPLEAESARHEAEIQQLTTQINIFQHAIQQSQNCPSVSGCPVLLRLRLPPAPTP